MPSEVVLQELTVEGMSQQRSQRMTLRLWNLAVLGKEQSIFEGEQLVGLLQISLQFDIVTDITLLQQIFFYYKEQSPQKLKHRNHIFTGTLKQITTHHQKHEFKIIKKPPSTPKNIHQKIFAQKSYKSFHCSNITQYQNLTPSMIEKTDIPTAQKEESESEQIDTEFEDYHMDSYSQSQDLDLEEDYLNRLKQQRKRIEQLSQLHLDNEDKLRREVERNRILSEEISRLSAAKEYQVRFSEVSSELQARQAQNRALREQLANVKDDVLQASSDKTQTIQRLKYELAMQRDKDSARIEHLEQQLANKQDECDRLTRDIRLRERQLQQTINNQKNKIDVLMQEHDSYLRTQQRKADKLQRDLMTKSACLSDLQSANDSLQKENSQMKQEIFRLSSILGSRELQLKNQSQKFKLKLSSLKKEMKAKEKECSQLKESFKRQEREAKQCSSESQSLRIQLKKVLQAQEMERHKLQLESNKEKQSLQLTINNHLATIQQLLNVKNDLLAENKKLMTIIKKKEAVQKQRKALLKTEMKEIDKLQKVIDKIVE